jgi:ankyrin repeat protein
MTPLHWAAVKGSKACIRHLVTAGANLEAKEENGKTPRDMAEELKGSVPFLAGLEEAGYDRFGRKREGRLSDVSFASWLVWKKLICCSEIPSLLS